MIILRLKICKNYKHSDLGRMVRVQAGQQAEAGVTGRGIMK